MLPICGRMIPKVMHLNFSCYPKCGIKLPNLNSHSGTLIFAAESDGLGTLSMTFSTFSGLELSEAEGPAFGSKNELVFLCIVVQSLDDNRE
jgi:hypothetical protein